MLWYSYYTGELKRNKYNTYMDYDLGYRIGKQENRSKYQIYSGSGVKHVVADYYPEQTV